jgi:hypothetical protein
MPKFVVHSPGDNRRDRKRRSARVQHREALRGVPLSWYGQEGLAPATCSVRRRSPARGDVVGQPACGRLCRVALGKGSGKAVTRIGLPSTGGRPKTRGVITELTVQYGPQLYEIFGLNRWTVRS